MGKCQQKLNLSSVLKKSSGNSNNLKILQTIFDNLIESYNNFKSDKIGEFTKQLSIATGVWTDPNNLVEDIQSVMNLVNTNPPSGFGSVQMMTMRKAKGLEADVVVMVGLEDDIIPSKISSIEEEVRLFYVSMTRAKQKLYLCILLSVLEIYRLVLKSRKKNEVVFLNLSEEKK